jgi:hypothetical protein
MNDLCNIHWYCRRTFGLLIILLISTGCHTVNPKALPSSTSSRIFPLGERDILPNGNSVYQLVLEYSFEIEEAKNNSVTLRWPIWNEILYESPFTGQFYMIFDSLKQLVSCGGNNCASFSLFLMKLYST